MRMNTKKEKQMRKSTINIIKPNRADPNLYGQISLRLRVVALDRLNKQAAKNEITLGEYIGAILEQAAKEGRFDIIKQSMLVKNESKNAAISRQIKTEEAPNK